MGESDRRHGLHAELLRRFIPTMTGDDLISIISKDGVDEPELLDALRDLPDLLARVNPRIPRVRLQRADVDIFGLHFVRN